MNKIEKIEKLLHGEKIDEYAINLWKHFPPYDESPNELANKIIQFQERFKWDFIKVTYHGYFSSKDWGLKIKWPKRDCEWPDTCTNVGTTNDILIKERKDWEKLSVLPVNEGSWGDSILTARRVVDRYKGRVPVVVTVFSPLTTATKLSGMATLLSHMRKYPNNFKKGIEAIANTTINFVKELVKVGADGIFYASQLANYDLMSLHEYEEYGMHHDLQILDTVKNKMWFNIMHMHGNDPMFELMEKYPVQALNWHDRLVDISLKDGKALTDKVLIGGIDEYKVLNNENEVVIQAHLRDALEQVDHKKIILGPGCCIPLYVSEDRFEIVKNALKRIK